MEPAKPKVLLVEDDFIIFERLYSFLTEEGFEVLEKKEYAAVDNFDDAVFLLNKYAPDLAILDIQINGKKDGIELAAYIKGNSDIPIVFLSDYNTPEYLDRITDIAGVEFVVKMEKPFNITKVWPQIWTSVKLKIAQNQKKKNNDSTGSLMKVYEHKEAKPGDESPLSLEVFIIWKDIVYIKTLNARLKSTTNNNILIYLKDGRVYRSRNTLSAMEEQVPAYLVRCNQSEIINANLVEARTTAQENMICYINNLAFPVSATYRQKVIDQINLARGGGN